MSVLPPPITTTLYFMRSFAEGDANTLLSKITDKVLQYESSLDYTIGRDTLVSEAIEVMQALSPALQSATGNPFGTVGSEYSTAWAGTNFEAAFKKYGEFFAFKKYGEFGGYPHRVLISVVTTLVAKSTFLMRQPQSATKSILPPAAIPVGF